MKYIKFLSAGVLILFLASCSKKTMDSINRDLNDPTDVPAANILPSAIVSTVFGTAGTDLAWYSSVYTEQSAGVDEQFYDADRRNGITASSLMDNVWNSTYNNLGVLKDIISRTSSGGSNPSPAMLGIAQVLTAYNLAIVTDMWGDVPWSDALKGSGNVHPKYDKQQDVYTAIFGLLNNAIANLSGSNGSAFASEDLIYGGNTSNWLKAAWSLKARYFMHLERVVPTAIDSVLACIPKGFTSGSNAFIFSKYENTQIGSNPWFDFTYMERGDFCAGATLYNLMESRNDPRIQMYFVPIDNNGDIVPAPNGTSDRTRAGNGEYSYSNITAGSEADATVPTPLMTYHELLFLEAEALARKGQSFTAVLQQAIEAAFVFHGLTIGEADNYYTTEVAPRLGTTMAENLQEILTQKYIGMYEQESIEVYNDVRRNGIPTMNNPNNNLSSFGFPERFPYASSEVTSNPQNVPTVNIFKDKIWWDQ
ncbi:MAG: SusD/RagB family nutrient-binding outer membrane lipoprotein [Chitinophagaceae bacterium]|nr:SusD/RagB family nutrient-binding outer membrane lipoprotein [Chitinophagaceae bacterium]